MFSRFWVDPPADVQAHSPLCVIHSGQCKGTTKCPPTRKEYWLIIVNIKVQKVNVVLKKNETYFNFNVA